jgi:hypothetical protein
MTYSRPPRWFIADDVLSGRVSLDGYPFRYIYISIAPNVGVSAIFGGGPGYAARVDGVFSAVELLEARGWQLVNFDQGGQIAYLRAPR